MKWPLAAALAVGVLGVLSACDTERKKECDQLTPALKPLDDPKPSSDAIGRLRGALEALALEDQPLREYVRTTKGILVVLSSTLVLDEGPLPPDGTDEVVKAKLKEARTVRDDIAHYCAQ